MKIEGKVLWMVSGAIVISLGITLAAQLPVLREQGIEMTHSSMRGMVVAGEQVRQLTSLQHASNSFRIKELLDDMRNRNIPLQEAPIYNTIPVVAAWKSIGSAAAKEGYVFRVVRANPRNSKNQPTPEEQRILDELDATKAEELLQVDEARKLVVYARPIHLTADCLACHGDPSTSPSGDGRDMLGYRMEGWKADELRGAFILTAGFDKLNA